MLKALKQALVTKMEAGTNQSAYSRVISTFAAGQFIKVWQPRGDSSGFDGLERGFISLAGNAGYNALQELFPLTRPRGIRDHTPSAPTSH